MKKWNNPELMMLGVENTQEGGCTHSDVSLFNSDGDTGLNKGHYCHQPFDPCPGGNNDHSAAGNKNHVFTGKVCPEHNDANEGNEACCCYGLS